MLDAYSFDKDENGMAESYNNLRAAFLEIFEKIGMPVIPIVADNGAMGGKKSEEGLPTIAEDTYFIDRLAEMSKPYGTEIKMKGKVAVCKW